MSEIQKYLMKSVFKMACSKEDPTNPKVEFDLVLRQDQPLNLDWLQRVNLIRHRDGWRYFK